MSWQTEALGGPVLAWEVKRATRRKLWRCLQIGYCAWLVIEAVALFGAMLPTSWDLPNEPHSRLEVYRTMYAQEIEFLDDYLVLLLQFQLVNRKEGHRILWIYESDNIIFTFALTHKRNASFEAYFSLSTFDEAGGWHALRYSERGVEPP